MSYTKWEWHASGMQTIWDQQPTVFVHGIAAPIATTLVLILFSNNNDVGKLFPFSKRN